MQLGKRKKKTMKSKLLNLCLGMCNGFKLETRRKSIAVCRDTVVLEKSKVKTTVT